MTKQSIGREYEGEFDRELGLKEAMATATEIGSLWLLRVGRRILVLAICSNRCCQKSFQLLLLLLVLLILLFVSLWSPLGWFSFCGNLAWPKESGRGA